MQLAQQAHYFAKGIFARCYAITDAGSTFNSNADDLDVNILHFSKLGSHRDDMRQMMKILRSSSPM